MDRTTVHYTIVPQDPVAHHFRVTCRIATPSPDGQAFSMAAWIPGSYMIRDFARHVIALRAFTEQGPVRVAKTGKQSWRCVPAEGPLQIEYEVYAWDLSVRAAHLDQTHGFFNGTSVFVLPHGFEDAPCQVEVLPPPGINGWQVATALPRLETSESGFGTYQAASFDELIDHPVEMGSFTRATFNACGVPHEIVLTGRHRADLGQITQDLTRICEHHIRFFGEPAPMDRYVFLVMVTGDGYGGLEHRASTSLLCAREDLPYTHDRTRRAAYLGFLGLASHEYFHTWNVKRIKPAAFMPYDLFRENHTQQLWAFEGITSYYDDLALVRTGLMPVDTYLETLSRTINRVAAAPGRFRQSVAESSFDAWTKFYRPDENTPNAVVNYYTKGSLVALALDLTIRRATGNTRSLDTVMRLLWDRFGRTGTGVPEDGVEQVATEVAGQSLDDFFQAAVYGTEELLLAPLFQSAGIKMEETDTSATGNSALGVLLESGPAARLKTVLTGSPAHLAGLSAGDEIIAIDGLRVDASSLSRRIETYVPGCRVQIQAFRRDELMTFDVTLQVNPNKTVRLLLDEQASAQQKQFRQDWLWSETR